MQSKIEQSDKAKAIAKELKAKSRKKNLCKMLYVDPKSSFYIIFDSILTFAILYSCITSAYFFCYNVT